MRGFRYDFVTDGAMNLKDDGCLAVGFLAKTIRSVVRLTGEVTNIFHAGNCEHTIGNDYEAVKKEDRLVIQAS